MIEDDRPSLDLLTRLPVRERPLEVTTARDGPSGLEAVRRVRPDAVLLDIRLPGIDGWAVLEALKADPETRDIPVIVVSIVDERARGVALGAAAYLVKPVSRDDLLAALARGRCARSATHAHRAGDEVSDMSRQPDPGRRGQPEEPQAGPGRARVLRLRGDRGDRRARTASGWRARRRPT